MGFVRLFFSFYAMLVLMAILAVGAAVATFIENDFGVETSKVLVYNAKWYEVVMVLTAINMAGIIYRFKMWQKPGRFLIHFAFIVILIGAGLTRYFGYEGILHIREGQTTNQMISYEPYLQVEITKNGETYYSEYPLMLPKTASAHFDKTLTLEGQTIEIALKDFTTLSQDGMQNDVTKFDVSAQGITRQYALIGSMGMEGIPQTKQFEDMTIKMTRGSKSILLPFSMKLREFDLRRYPGSRSPSSYASEVTVIDKENQKEFDFRIFMNNTLNYGGYKFFQSSYDMDEKGTVLSVNKDPGKIPTYIGYFLLTLGFLMNIFDKKSRFAKLGRYIKEVTAVFAIALFLGTTPTLQANDDLPTAPVEDKLEILKQFTKEYKLNSLQTAEQFGKLVTQNHNGRMMPVNTLTTDLLTKISKKSELFGLTPDQAILGMMTAPEIWQQLKFIRVKHPELEEKLGAKDGFISFNDAFSEDGRYIIKDDVESAIRKDPKEMGTYDKEIIRVDERLNITYMIFNGSILRLFPKPNDPNHTWYPPLYALEDFQAPYNREVADAVQGFFGSVINADWERADRYAQNIKEYQQKYGGEVMPSDSKIDIEIFSNQAKIFPNLTIAYLFTGLILLVVSFIKVFKPNLNISRVQMGFVVFLGLLFVVQTAAMGLRWYISGHAPWSDSYESMIYIAWSTMLAALLFFRSSIFALAGAVIMTAAFMFSAHLSWIDPQITTLVPVLKSYWLTIHVSVITASYGFFGLGAILGFFALILFLFRSENKTYIDTEIKKITAINEAALILGLSLFTIGNFLGGVWANESWGRYWGWDPKETWSYVLIVVYAIAIHLRFIKSLNTPYVFSVASLLSFATVLMTYYGVNFYLSGMHSYASGDPVPIPTWVYVLIIVTFATIAAAFRKRDLEKVI
jgi:cytochrome c-type biogenesis protein CcsB